MRSSFSLIDMANFSLTRLLNLVNNRILALSFETTLSCNCNCQHCDLGGFKKNEKQIRPADYQRIVLDLKPLVVQLSGGEPLLRSDILEIVRAVKVFGNLPYTIIVSNGALLSDDIYLNLKKAGINQLSVSLDFPDERHDWFRRKKGLFIHLENTIPRLAKYGFGDIILNSCITRANFKEVISLAEKAAEWGVKISYSAYTSLRNKNRELAFLKKTDLDALRSKIFELIEFKRKTNCIVNSEAALMKFLKFLENGSIPNCKAGIKFAVVMPDGIFVPCSLRRIRFSNIEHLREKFSHANQCGECYVAIRCYSEESILEQIRNLPQYLNRARK